MPARDMTKAQFDRECERLGFRAVGFMGYYRLPLDDGGSISSSVLNAGSRRRDQLAYLVQTQQRLNKAIAAAKDTP